MKSMRHAHGLSPVGLAIVAVAATLLLPTHAEAQRGSRNAVTPRIAFANMRVLLDSTPGRLTAEANLASETRLGETRVRLAADTLQRAVEQFSRLQNEISPVQREAATLNLRARELQLEDMVQQVTAIVNQRRAALQEPLVACVRSALERVQRDAGWDAIVDVGALGELYVLTPAADITSVVVGVIRGGKVSECAGG